MGYCAGDARPDHKHAIRQALHPQLRELWTHPPLDTLGEKWLVDEPEEGEITVIRRVGEYRFAPLICAETKLLAELDLVILRPSPPGRLIRQGGDVDNQLKTLFDALRAPHEPAEILATLRPAKGKTRSSAF